MNADCHYGDHTWGGTSQCKYCPARIRCVCGCYVREDNPGHYDRCRVIERLTEGVDMVIGGSIDGRNASLAAVVEQP